MAISLRLPQDIESQLVSFSARQGISKSALIVRSIQEFLNRNVQPSAYQLYLAATQNVQDDEPEQSQRETLEQRSTKLAVRGALRAKHAQRSERASRALRGQPRSA